MTALGIHGIGVCATGLPDWESTRAVLAGDAAATPSPIETAEEGLVACFVTPGAKSA